MATHSGILAWNIPGQRSLAGAVHGDAGLDLTEHICIRLLPLEFKIFSKREERYRHKIKKIKMPLPKIELEMSV